MLISETAHYYYGKWPELDDAQQYRVIGMKISEKYPAIGLEGTNQSCSPRDRGLGLGLGTAGLGLGLGLEVSVLKYFSRPPMYLSNPYGCLLVCQLLK